MNYKRFIACIYLYHTHAVKSLKDTTIVDTNPVKLAKYYSENNTDELIIFDMSDTPEEHTQALDIMKDICSSIEISVIGTGNIHRMEDVKKLLYVGCKKVALNFDYSENVLISEEVGLKFGKEKLLIAFNDISSIQNNLDLVNQYSSELLLLNPHQIRETQAIIDLPIIVQINQIAFNKLLEIYGNSNVYGVTGNTINDSVKEILSLKEICKQNGIQVETLECKISWSDLKKNSDEMIPVIVQDYKTEEVLMLAYMNEESFLYTLKTGKMTYFSRSRNELWLKGDTSGHFQYVKALTADCDKDTILARVSQVGAACHTGKKSCFFNEIAKKDCTVENPLRVFEDVFSVIKDRKINPKKGSYTNYLFNNGVDKILKKLGEEATEIVIAAKNPNPNEIKYEISDFLYHMMVLMAEKEVSWEEIIDELAKR